MGIFAMLTFVNTHHLYHPHHLHSTYLVIDGPNLEKSLSLCYLNTFRADHLYGGDYNHLYKFYESFFTTLHTCKVTPIVIMDGSFDVSKLDRKLERYNARLISAISICKDDQTDADRVFSVLNSEVFKKVMRNLKIFHVQSIQEADDIIPEVARHFRCPILSNDSDFLIDPQIAFGVISIDSVLDHNFQVRHSQSGTAHMQCRLYRIEGLLKLYPNLKPELLPFCGPLLGNDRCDFREAGRIVGKIDKDFDFALSSKLNHVDWYKREWRLKQFYTVFEWLSMQSSYEGALSYLVTICDGDSMHPVVRAVRDSYCSRDNLIAQCLNTSTISNTSIDEYFTYNWNRLFPAHPEIPTSLLNSFINCRIPHYILDIYFHKLDLFSPLIEDFSLNRSSHQVIYRLSRYIYGLLRRTSPLDSDEEAERQQITRIDRHGQVICGPEQSGELVDPLLYVILQYDPLVYAKLPNLCQIETLSKDYRSSLFCAIIQIDLITFRERVRDILDTKINEKQIDQLANMLICLIYQCQNSSIDVWLEYVYALFTNVLLAGHIGSQSIPTLFKLPESFLARLKTYEQLQTDYISFQSRITHLYVSYQNVLSCIGFLNRILDLDYFHVDDYICSLQGSFIYNLTAHLSNCDNPLDTLEEKVLGIGEFSLEDTEVFRNLLNLVLNYCGFCDDDRYE